MCTHTCIAYTALLLGYLYHERLTCIHPLWYHYLHQSPVLVGDLNHLSRHRTVGTLHRHCRLCLWLVNYLCLLKLPLRPDHIATTVHLLDSWCCTVVAVVVVVVVAVLVGAHGLRKTLPVSFVISNRQFILDL